MNMLLLLLLVVVVVVAVALVVVVVLLVATAAGRSGSCRSLNHVEELRVLFLRVLYYKQRIICPKTDFVAVLVNHRSTVWV